MLRKQFRFWLFDGEGEGGSGSTGSDNSGKTETKTESETKTAETVSKAEFDALKTEREKELAELKAFREAKQKEEDAKKTLEQKALEAEQKVKQLERDNLVLKIAKSKGLPDELVDRIKGDDEAAITADIETLLKLVKTPGEGAVGGKTQPSTKAGTDTTTLSHTEWRARKLANQG